MDAVFLALLVVLFLATLGLVVSIEHIGDHT